MKIVKATVGPFKSINVPQTVDIDEEVTVFVGMNEAGKTVFLQALEKANDALGIAKYNHIDDYPRKDLSSYLKTHKTTPAKVTEITYRPTKEEIGAINDELHTSLGSDFEFTVSHHYDNKIRIGICVDEEPVIKNLRTESGFSSDAAKAIGDVKSIREIPVRLKAIDLTEKDKEILAAIVARIDETKWESVAESEVWEFLKARIPKFLYFSDYDLLPSKINLQDLADRVEQAKSNPKKLTAQHRAVLALLRMADISIADFTKSGGYEALKAKIEGVSISLTDQIMEFWKQNENLDVEVDIKTDSEDDAPFNSGPNLYLRIKNRKHRGVSTPFQQRSRGFIWFFSFLVWFDSVQYQLSLAEKSESTDLVLLLDEPGLALHALAQLDFLRYIDRLAKDHQVLYTTHSPFMVHSDRLFQVRMVEDQDKVGTVISASVSGSDPRTLFPLQAALGWTVAQNLFICERNLLVEGPSELIYLKVVSSILESQGRTGLANEITIVPVGGLDKVATFVALLGANGLKLAVLHDFRGKPEQRLLDLVKQKLISPKLILNASRFRSLSALGVDGIATDTEDLFEKPFYLTLFSQTFEKALGGVHIKETDLPSGDRIIDQLERYLDSKGVQTRQVPGFNHYAVAAYLASHPPSSLDEDTLKRFEALFKTVNDGLA